MVNYSVQPLQTNSATARLVFLLPGLAAMMLHKFPRLFASRLTGTSGPSSPDRRRMPHGCMRASHYCRHTGTTRLRAPLFVHHLQTRTPFDPGCIKVTQCTSHLPGPSFKLHKLSIHTDYLYGLCIALAFPIGYARSTCRPTDRHTDDQRTGHKVKILD